METFDNKHSISSGLWQRLLCYAKLPEVESDRLEAELSTSATTLNFIVDQKGH